MSESGKINLLKLVVLGRDYTFKGVSMEDEIRYREACKKVNDMVQRFRAVSPNPLEQDSQDLLSLTCLQLASKLYTYEEKEQQEEEKGSELEQIYEELDDFIKINQ